MVGFYLALPFVLVALLRMLVAIHNYLSRPYLVDVIQEESSLVSILISPQAGKPDITSLLEDISKQEYRHLEVIVCNPQNNEPITPSLQEFSANDQRFRLLEPEALPQGWTARNHARFRMAHRAKGQYLLFLEGSVKIEKQFVTKAVAYMQQNDLSLLSVFPRQILVNIGEQVAVPAMTWILLTLIPLRFVFKLRHPLFSAASSCMMMFRADEYKANGWHELFKGNAGPDLHIARDAKRAKLRVAALLGGGDISIKPNFTLFEAIDNASAKVSRIFGDGYLGILLSALVTTLSPIIVILLLPFPLVFTYLFSIIFSRMLVAMLCGQSPIKSVLLLPLQHLAFLAMARKVLQHRH